MSEDRGGTWGMNFVEFLNEAEFPATRQDLINYAEDNNLPQDVIDKIHDLPDRQYDSYADLVRGTVLS